MRAKPYIASIASEEGEQTMHVLPCRPHAARLLTCLIGLVSVAVAAVPAQAQQYTFQTIDEPNGIGNTTSLGINDAGLIVGSYYDGPSFGFSDSSGTFDSFSEPDAAHGTFANAINSDDEIVGTFTDSGYDDNGFTDIGGTFKQIDDPYAANYGTYLQGINDSAVTVGYYVDADTNYHGFTYSAGSFSTIDEPDADGYTYALGIDNSDEIAGYYVDSDSDYHGFVKSAGVYQTVDAPLGVNGTYVTAINNSGQLVGYYVDSEFDKHGFVDTGGVFATLDDSLGVHGTYPTGINDSGDVVGYYYDSSYDSHGFLAIPGPIVPAAPTDVSAAAGVEEVTVSWTGSANATDYHVDQAVTSSGPYTVVGIVSATSSATYSFTETGLTVGKTYYYAVTAVDGTDGTKSADSTQVSAAPTPPTPDAPANVAATAGVDQVTVSWSASQYATGYHVDRAVKSGGPYTLVTTVPNNGSDSYSDTDTGLSAGKTYYYVVTAVNSTYGTKSPNSTQVSATPLPPPPAAPTDVVATGGVEQVKVTWDASATATSYHVDRAVTSGGPYTLAATVPATSSTSYSYTDTGLTAGKTYYYVVTALDSNNGTKSANSAQVSATPS